jgi:DNA-directed RNA polymerase subunit M/transcription elongation factor TFIIS
VSLAALRPMVSRMSERPLRLGDVIDDYCPTCRLLLNHDVAAIFNGTVAKVTCRTCHNTHDFRNAQVPTRRKTKKAEAKSLVDQVLATLPVPNAPAPSADPPPQRKRRDLWAEVKRIQEQQQKKS